MYEFSIQIVPSDIQGVLRVSEVYQDSSVVLAGLIRNIAGKAIYKDDRFGSLELSEDLELSEVSDKIKIFVSTAMKNNPLWDQDDNDDDDEDQE